MTYRTPGMPMSKRKLCEQRSYSPETRNHGV